MDESEIIRQLREQNELLRLENETVMPGQAPMRHENRSWIEGMPETLIACGNGCTDMREAHFHIKCSRPGYVS